MVINLTDKILEQDYGIRNTNFKKGAKNVPLLVFEVIGPGSQSQETVKVDALRLRFLEPLEDDKMDAATLSKMLESVTIGNYAHLQGVDTTDFKNRHRLFTTFDLTDSSANPLTILWSPPYEFGADEKDTIVVLGTFTPQAQNQSFRMALEDVHAYDIDSDLSFAVVDSSGKPLSESTAMTTKRVSIVPTNPEEFISYPNPFGKSQEWANIRFFTENYANVEIYVFTLVGELVWSRSYQNQAPGSHDGAYDARYRWDGKNDKGYAVLNGVYLCVLKVTAIGTGGAPGETKTHTRKIAYIK